MSHREAFDRACEALCGDEGWHWAGDAIEVPTDEERHQRVSIEFFEFEDEELVRLYTVIGSSDRIHPLKLTQALRLNFGLPHGALGLRGDDLVMIDTLMVEGADAEEIAASVEYLAETGDHFEEKLFGSDEN